MKYNRVFRFFSAIFFFGLISVIFGCGGVGGSDPSSVTLTSISVTPTNPGIPVGATQQFKAFGTYSDATTNEITTQVIWASSNPSSSTINSSGIATGLAVGTSGITAALGSISGSALLAVTQSVFQGSLDGDWWVTCPMFMFGRTVSWWGQFISTIDSNGSIAGSFSGHLSGSISGRVDTTGNIVGSFETWESIPGSFSWQGQLTVSGVSLSGLGQLSKQLSSDVCYGMWQGTGTVSH